MRPLLSILLFVLSAELHGQITQPEYAQRRQALVAQLPDAAIVTFGAGEPKHDYLEFYQNPSMMYLTGVREPDAALVMVKENGRLSSTVFVLPRDPAAEVWTGLRIGTDGASRLTGLPVRTRDELARVLDSLGQSKLPVYALGDLPAAGALAAAVEQLRTKHPQLTQNPAVRALTQLRGKKSAAELALIKRSAEITVRSHEEAMRAARPRMFEYELEAVVEHGFRRAGAERPSFASIVGSGPNSTILHYNVNDRQIQPGEVVVMDVGASYMGYAADVTRTIPVNGTFSAEQKQIYQIVRNAQAAAERNAKPGMRAKVMSDSAFAVIAGGLAQLGLIESQSATYDAVDAAGNVRQESQVGLYYMHGLGHGIGLEVHDPDQFYFTGVVAEGSAFSIEPGIYVRPNVLEILADTPRNRALIAKIRPVVERYRNTGVRIEDDYIVTDKGLEWISRAPREIHEIETLMRRPVP